MKAKIALVLSSIALAGAIWNFICIVVLYRLIKVIGQELDELHLMFLGIFDVLTYLMTQARW